MADTSRDVTVPFQIESQLVVAVCARISIPLRPRPRVDEPTNWYIQIAGRLKPGVTLEQVKGNLAGPFEQAARAGMAGLHGRPQRDQSASCRATSATGTRVPHLLVLPGARGIYDLGPHVVAIGVDPQRDRRAAVVDRVRQRRQPAAVARRGALQGSVGAPVDGRIAASTGPSAADRKPAALGHRRRCSALRSATGARSCCRSARTPRSTARCWPSSPASAC